MDRRTVLKSGLVLFGSLASRSVWAQPFPGDPNRAAVVIGVDRPGTLPELRGAASGAREFAEFLSRQGIDVATFADDNGDMVYAGSIFQAVNALVESGNLDQLIIYFAGHGFLRGGNEYWLLSGAPENPNEAITVRDCEQAALRTGITNVVLISDACRSLPESLGASNLHGYIIFPNTGDFTNDVTVDKFFATHPGDASYEVPVQSSTAEYAGIYTRVLLEAFNDPPADRIKSIGSGRWVFPNRQLKWHLREKVPLRAQEENIKLFQVPQSVITSDEPWNIGYVQAPANPAVPTAGPSENIERDTFEALGELVNQIEETQAVAYAQESGWEYAASIRTKDFGSDKASDQAEEKLASAIARFNEDIEVERSGVVIYGDRIADIYASPRVAIEEPENADKPMVLFSSDFNRPESVLVKLDSGAVIAVPVMETFATHVYVLEGDVRDIHLNPTRESNLFDDFAYELPRLQYLRTLAGEATRAGALTFEGTQDERNRTAQSFADQIRILKGVDPVLGLYAAYAYSAALLPEGARSVADIMKGSLQYNLFDVEMLAGGLSGPQVNSEDTSNRVTPFCPLLRQGWEILRVSDVNLHPLVANASPGLREGLWTAFDPEPGTLLGLAVRNGEI